MSDVLDPRASYEAQQTLEGLNLRARQEQALRMLRAEAPPHIKFRTEDELRVSLAATLEGTEPASDVFVFGYGSIMWNPGVQHAGELPALLHGWHRSYCLRLFYGRGSVQQPGLMLALEPGGSCRGLLLRIPAAVARPELLALWKREMSTGAYLPRWVTTRTEAGPVRALTFVINPSSDRYTRGLPLADMVKMIRSASGSLGTSRSYFESTIRKLQAMAVTDSKMEHLRLAILDADAAERDSVRPGG